MANIKSTYRNNSKVLWKLVNRSIKYSAKSGFEIPIDGSDNRFSSHAGKVKF